MAPIYSINHEQPLDLNTPTAVTIGNFDGCHRGHQNLLSSAKSQADLLKLKAIALTFEPRPDHFFKTPINPRLLFTKLQKLRAFEESEIDTVIIQRFDENFAQISPESFVVNYLSKKLLAKSITVGENFRFGNSRQGDIHALKRIGNQNSIEIKICHSVQEESEIISSSRIRNALSLGQVKQAANMLGRPYLLEGTVVKGDQLGRQLGTPTANMINSEQIIPAPGVYLVRAHIGNAPTILSVSHTALPAICNIGYRPTIKSTEPELRIETHILAGNIGLDDLYGLSLGIYFDDRLRNEQKFQNLDDLKSAISRDLDIARNFYNLNKF